MPECSHPYPTTAGARNKVMKYLDRKGFDPNIIEAASFPVEIGKYQNYGELLKNSVESYPLRDKIVLLMKDMVWVEQRQYLSKIYIL